MGDSPGGVRLARSDQAGTAGSLRDCGKPGQRETRVDRSTANAILVGSAGSGHRPAHPEAEHMKRARTWLMTMLLAGCLGAITSCSTGIRVDRSSRSEALFTAFKENLM